MSESKPLIIGSSGNLSEVAPNMFPNLFANPLRMMGMTQVNGANATGIQNQGINNTQLSKNGTDSAASDSDGAWNNYLSASSSGANAGWSTAASWAEWQCYPAFIVAIKPVDITAVRIWCGWITSGGIYGSDSPATGTTVAFRFSSTAGDTNWQCCTSDGTTGNTVDSGVAVVSGTSYVLAVYKDPSTGNAIFIINGQVVATISTHLPASTTDMYSIYTATTTTSIAKNIKLKCAFHSQR